MTEGRVEVRYDVRIPTKDAGITLSADVYLPVDGGPAPALLTAHPYRKDVSSDPLLRWFAERGYVTVVLDLRGMGSSDGRYREFAVDERDDVASSIEWFAEQPWCDGNVGMWGASYGGWTALSAAAVGPAPLKAIIAVEGPTDPERDLIHPDGARSDLRTCFRTLLMLVHQLTPPLRETGPEHRRRWRERLSDAEPAFLDIAGWGPGDPAWREMAIDPSAITCPVLCIGGWRDFVLSSLTRAYEQIGGPKKLLIGPWGHTLPHLADVARVDFPAIALRWFDYWLRGDENGVMDELPVALHLPDRGWGGFAVWPPTTRELALRTGADLTLSESGAATACPIGEYRPDPTIGALRAFWGSTLSGVAPLPDQHDDDMRALSATTDPLSEDLLILGRPEVSIELSHGDVRRVVVALTDVDPRGRSTLVATGVVTPDRRGSHARVVLAPTTWRFRSGHRVRVAISDSDYPRLTPLPDPSPFAVTAIELVVPTLSEDEGTAVCVPEPEAVSYPAPAASRALSVTRELIDDRVEVVMTNTSDDQDSEIRASVWRSHPKGAVLSGRQSRRVRLSTGEDVRVLATIRCSHLDVCARAEVSVDGEAAFSREWRASFNAGPVADEEHAGRPAT